MPDKPFHELSALGKADIFLAFQASLATERRPGLSELEAAYVKHFAAWCDDHDHRSRLQAAAGIATDQEQPIRRQEER